MAKKIKLKFSVKKPLAPQIQAALKAIGPKMKAVVPKKGVPRLVLGVKLPIAPKPAPAKFQLPSIIKAGVRKIVMDADKADREAAAAWVDADEKAIPVESDKPGVARHPKPPKVHVPLKFDTDKDQSARIQVLEIHLAALLERLSLEYGGIHTEALLKLKSDTKK